MNKAGETIFGLNVFFAKVYPQIRGALKMAPKPKNPEEARTSTHKSEIDSKINLKNGKFPFTNIWKVPPVEEMYKILD